MAAILALALGRSTNALSEGKWLTIDTKGKPCTPFTDNEPVMFERALKYGFKDALGKITIEPRYWHVEPFHNGLTEATESQEAECKVIDRSGKEQCVIPKEVSVSVTDEYPGVSENGLLPVKRRMNSGDEVGIFNIKVKKYIPLGVGLSIKEYSEGLAAVYSLGPPRYGFIDANGKSVIARQFEYADNFSEGLAAVLLHDRWCYIDRQGKKVIELPEKCSLATAFHDGMAAVALGGSDKIPGYLAVRVDAHWGFIDKTGKLIIPAKFFLDRERGIGKANNTPHFASGLAHVATGDELDHKYGFINRSGDWVINPQYKDAEDFAHGCARVCLGATDDILSGWKIKERDQYRREKQFALFLKKYKLIRMSRPQVEALLGAANKCDFGLLDTLGRAVGKDDANPNVVDTYDLYTTASNCDHRSVQINYEKGIATRYRYVGTRDAGIWFDSAETDKTLD